MATLYVKHNFELSARISEIITIYLCQISSQAHLLILLAHPPQLWCGDLVPSQRGVQVEAGAVPPEVQAELGRGDCGGQRRRDVGALSPRRQELALLRALPVRRRRGGQLPGMAQVRMNFRTEFANKVLTCRIFQSK